MKIYLLSDKKVNNAVNLPVLQINFIRQGIDFNSYNALIFTSKNSLYALDTLYDDTWKVIPSYAIAPQTAKIIENLKANLTFTGVTNHGDQFAQELVPLLKNKKVLYLRGSKVVSSLVEILNSNNVVCDEVIVYESNCKIYKTKPLLEDDATFIFSSPSTIECFLKNFIWKNSYKAVAIGKTTAKYFPSYIKYIISDSTSLESCVKKAIEINNTGDKSE